MNLLSFKAIHTVVSSHTQRDNRVEKIDTR